ncbi:MAG: hypothetical protein ACFFEY_21120 [Candidatus Thorarchaeota archaeon]
MDGMVIFLEIILNSLPLLILIIPLLFIWKKTVGKLYFRIFVGVVVFFLIYWILPIIFQITTEPKELAGGDTMLAIQFIGARIGTLLTLFATYPLVTLPFIFFVAPFISLIIVWNRVRKEEGSFKENLQQITYTLDKSPFKMIRDELVKNKFSREKEILKLMIVLLPISLYILQVILSVTGLEKESLTTGSTSLGWFLEILFVYLATFIFSIELIFSSKIALKGKYFGEEIRTQMFKSLYTVGAPISILSILLFLAQYYESILIIIYFFMYFIMASIIFILFLKVFEPISILILVKLVDWWKKKKERIRNIDTSNILLIIFYGLLAIGIFFIVYLAISSFIYYPFFRDPQILTEAQFTESSPNILNSLKFELLISLGFLQILLPVIIVGIFISKSLKYAKSKFIAYIIFLPVIIIISIFLFAAEEYWLTGQITYIAINSSFFYTFRTASLAVNFSGVLNGLAIPYLYTRYIFNIIIWSLIIFYKGKLFKAKTLSLDEKHLEKYIFATVGDFIRYDDYDQSDIQYLVTKNEDIIGKNLEKERDEIKSLLNKLDIDRFLKEIRPLEKDEKQRFYFTLRYLFNHNYIKIWKPELSYVYEPVEKQGLYIIYDDGRGVYNYAFQQDSEQDPGLVSGMFSAITSFVKEMTKSTEALKKIDHGDITILLEYGERIFGALFIKGPQTTEVRAPLKEFVSWFEEHYKDVLKDWTGSLQYFKVDENKEKLEKMFKED